MRHSNLAAEILEGSWLGLGLAGHLVEECIPVLISHCGLRLILLLLYQVGGCAQLAQKILRDWNADRSLVEGALIIRVVVAVEVHELLVKGTVHISHLAISQLLDRRQIAMAAGPLLPRPVLLGGLDLLGDSSGLSSLVPHLTQRLIILRRLLQRGVLDDSLRYRGLLLLLDRVLGSRLEPPQLHPEVLAREVAPIDVVKDPGPVDGVPRTTIILRKALVAIEMHYKRSPSRTNHSKEDAAVSGHDLTVLNHAHENEFIGELLSWQQFSLEELLETPTILALVYFKDGLGICLQPVGLPAFDDQAIEHGEGVATSPLALHDPLILLLRGHLRESMHLLPQHEYWVAEHIVDGVNGAVVHKMSRQWLLPEEVVMMQQGVRVIDHAIVHRVQVAPGMALSGHLGL